MKKNMKNIIEPKTIKFEFQELDGVTIVALDASLSDFKPQPVLQNGIPVMQIKERTIKDCRNIDGRIYFHLGRVSDTVMIDLIEKFWKLRKEKGWKPNKGLFIPEQ